MMDTFMDLNTAPLQDADLIPAGTLAKAQFKIKPGGIGPQGWLTQSKSTCATYINGEFTICSGPYSKHKIFTLIGMTGSRLNEEGEDIWAMMGRKLLRGLIESARGIYPKDNSEKAQEARKINTFADLQGLTCIIKIGIDLDKGGAQRERNKVVAFVTPDHSEYVHLMAEDPGTPSSAVPTTLPWDV